MKKHYLVIIAVVMLIAAVSIGIYVNKGGFQKATSAIVEVPQRVLIAQHYKGSFKTKDFDNCFKDATTLVKQGTLKGDIVAYYINNPDKADGIADAYIGVMLTDTSGITIPGKYEKILLPNRKVVKANIKANFTVASSIYKETQLFAKENKLKLKDVEVLENYTSENEFILETPILEIKILKK